MTVLVEWARVLVGVIYLNLLWLLGCVTVVGAPAATVASVTVARSVQAGEDPPITRAFFTSFASHWRAASAIGLPWLGLGVILLVDVLIVRAFGGPMVQLVLGPLFVLGLLYALVSVFVPLTVASRTDQPNRYLLRLALGTALARPGAGIQVLLAAGLATGAIVFVPPLVLILPAVVCHIAVLAWRLRVTPMLVQVA